MLIEKPKIYSGVAGQKRCCLINDKCTVSTLVYCECCWRPACGNHLYRDELDGLIDVCTDCALDAAVVLAAGGKAPLKERLTRELIKDLARAPQLLAPRGLTFDQAQRYEREVGHDLTVLSKLGIRCSALYPLGPGQVVFCNLGRGHVGPHRAGGSAVWEGQDAY